MKVFAIILTVSLVILGVIVAAIFTKQEAPPVIQDGLGAVVYSSNSEGKESYLIFVGQTPKPMKVPIDSAVFKFDAQMEKPTVKIWFKEKEIVEKAEIWFKDKDQVREYLR